MPFLAALPLGTNQISSLPARPPALGPFASPPQAPLQPLRGRTSFPDPQEWRPSHLSTQIMQLLMKGNRQRTQEPTAANQTSSRSHAVLQVAVRQRSRVKNVLQEVRQGRLFMVDLAGSERASQVRSAPPGLGRMCGGAWGEGRDAELLASQEMRLGKPSREGRREGSPSVRD